MSLRIRSIAAALLLVAPLALACGRSEEPKPPPAPMAPAPPPRPAAPPPAPPAAAPGAAAPAPSAFRLTSVDLGTAVGPDRKVTEPATSFAPSDTIYASVASDGSAPSVTLLARWTYEDGQEVSTDTQTVSPIGPTATEFHISKPSGWPAGRYRVEVSAEGSPGVAKDFEVK